jgi:hypothetical protein
LDFWAAFTVPAGKQNGYNNMIGNIPSLVYPVPTNAGPNATDTLQQQILNLPLPFFYGRDSGVALPTAALPYNDMRINFSFRDWRELLIYQLADDTSGPQKLPSDTFITSSALTSGTNLTANVWANYAIVSNDERKRMACAPRDILIEQVQTAPRQNYLPTANYSPNFDIRFSHAIKVLFFAVRNTTGGSDWSNYTTVSPVVKTPSAGVRLLDSRNHYLAADPIDTTSLIYENTNRLSDMGSDYFSLVNPYYHAPVIPYSIGYHCYSYSLDFICLDPMGSTNYGKLTNVSIVPKSSASANTAAGATSAYAAANNQKYEFIVTAVNNNIIRISGGALGFPVL